MQNKYGKGREECGTGRLRKDFLKKDLLDKVLLLKLAVALIVRLPVMLVYLLAPLYVKEAPVIVCL